MKDYIRSFVSSVASIACDSFEHLHPDSTVACAGEAYRVAAECDRHRGLLNHERCPSLASPRNLGMVSGDHHGVCNRLAIGALVSISMNDVQSNFSVQGCSFCREFDRQKPCEDCRNKFDLACRNAASNALEELALDAESDMEGAGETEFLQAEHVSITCRRRAARIRRDGK